VSGQGRSLRSTIALYWGLAARHNYAGIFRLLASDPRDYFRGREGAFYGFCCGRYVTGWEEARWKLSERNELPGSAIVPTQHTVPSLQLHGVLRRQNSCMLPWQPPAGRRRTALYINCGARGARDSVMLARNSRRAAAAPFVVCCCDMNNASLSTRC